MSGPASPFVPARFGHSAPKRAVERARVVTAVHTMLTVLALSYLLWANYVIFKGGNAPLTPWHLSDGDAGTGTFMLFIGDWLLLLAFQLLVNGPLEYLLSGLLQPSFTDGVFDSDRPLPATPLAELMTPPATLWQDGRFFIPSQPGSPQSELPPTRYSYFDRRGR